MSRLPASVVLGALVLAGCGDRSPFPGMGSRSVELPRGVSADELPDAGSRGAELVSRYCSGCHAIPSPSRHSAGEWEVTARRMFRRMEHMEHMGRGMMGRMMRGRMMEVAAPDPAEAETIVAYLKEHAMPATAEERLPAGEGRETFVRVCSRCHALPDPGQHLPAEWPAVVDRMRANMERMEVPGISDAETARIIRYLRNASGGGR